MSTMEQAKRIGDMIRGGGDHASGLNVGDGERIASTLAGGILAIYGLSRGSFGGWLVAALGGILAYRGVTGHCPVYATIGIDTAEGKRVRGNLGIKVDKSVIVEAPPERLYGVWRNFENLPRFMSHLDRVTVVDRHRSHWRVKTAVGIVEWDAEIINDQQNELIAWRTLDNQWVDHAGSVRFEPFGLGRTLVRVSLQYDPPGGKLGRAVVSLLGEDPETQIQQDLGAFKRAIEAGELAA
jgi:uncharacterized membrane protein